MGHHSVKKVEKGWREYQKDKLEKEGFAVLRKKEKTNKKIKKAFENRLLP